MPARATIREPARDVPVFRTCDVLVVGGGPAGTTAAAAAAQLGADTLLVERYGHLGGMSTGGFVVWIEWIRQRGWRPRSRRGSRVRDVDVAEVQRQLAKQGAWLPAR